MLLSKINQLCHTATGEWAITAMKDAAVNATEYSVDGAVTGIAIGTVAAFAILYSGTKDKDRSGIKYGILSCITFSGSILACTVTGAAYGIGTSLLKSLS